MSYEESEQGEEGKTSLVKPGSEGLGRIINEVKCVLYLWRRVGFRETNPIFTGSVAMLFEKVFCSLKKIGSIHSGVVSHLQSGQKKKERWK